MDKFDHSVSLLGWAFNEEASIKEYLERATALMDATVSEYEIILIDDGSQDKTFTIADEFRRTRNPRLRIFQNERNLNVGISSRRAFKLASKEYLFWQTIDWAYDIGQLREFLEHLKEYDIVQGVRRRPTNVRLWYLKPFVVFLKLFNINYMANRSDTIWKAFISIVNFIIIRLLFRVPLSDFQNVTFYPTKWLQSLEFEAKSSFANPEGLIKSYWSGMSIKEVEINFIPRKAGEANGTKMKAISSSISDILRLWFKWKVLGKVNFKGKGKIVRADGSTW